MSVLLAAGEGSGFEAPTHGRLLAAAVRHRRCVRDHPRRASSSCSRWRSSRWWLLATTRTAGGRPGQGAVLHREVYGLVRNGLAPRHHRQPATSCKFVPLLFSHVRAHPGEQPLRHHPADAVPDDEPDRLPRGARARRLRRLPRHRHPQGWVSAATSSTLVPPGCCRAGSCCSSSRSSCSPYFFTRPVTLALRLFGNMFAGHLLLAAVRHRRRVPDVRRRRAGVRSPVGAFSCVMAFVMTIFELLVRVPAGLHLHPADRLVHRRLPRRRALNRSSVARSTRTRPSTTGTTGSTGDHRVGTRRTGAPSRRPGAPSDGTKGSRRTMTRKHRDPRLRPVRDRPGYRRRPDLRRLHQRRGTPARGPRHAAADRHSWASRSPRRWPSSVSPSRSSSADPAADVHRPDEFEEASVSFAATLWLGPPRRSRARASGRPRTRSSRTPAS